MRKIPYTLHISNVVGSTCPEDSYGVECSGVGTCDRTTLTCDCNIAFTGPACETEKGSPNICNSHVSFIHKLFKSWEWSRLFKEKSQRTNHRDVYVQMYPCRIELPLWKQQLRMQWKGCVCWRLMSMRHRIYWIRM